MNKCIYIYRVSFSEPPRGAFGDYRTEFFFTSLSAIYELFTAEQIGCVLQTLWNKKVSKGAMYVSRDFFCSITREPLLSKPQSGNSAH